MCRVHLCFPTDVTAPPPSITPPVGRGYWVWGLGLMVERQLQGSGVKGTADLVLEVWHLRVGVEDSRDRVRGSGFGVVKRCVVSICASPRT